MATRKSPAPARKHARKHAGPAQSAPSAAVPTFTAPATSPRASTNPVFAEPGYMQDPTQYRTPHASDSNAYRELDQLTKLHQFNPLPFRVVQGTREILDSRDDIPIGSSGSLRST